MTGEKIINLLLDDGTLSGIISIEASSWNSGELYFSPRSSVQKLLTKKTEAFNKYGVYLLLSQNKVYVGQSSDLAKRLTQHTTGKDWWERVVIFTTKDDGLTKSDIDYLEYILIEKAFSIEKLECDNKKKGNPPKVDKFRKVQLNQYLEEALFLIQLIGITEFSEGNEKSANQSSKKTTSTINAKDIKPALSFVKKKEVLQYLIDYGITFGENVTYAARQGNRDEYWANPKLDFLDDDWHIVLNDNKNMCLTVLFIPAKTLSIRSDKNMGLYVRKDRPQIDLNINVSSLIDRRSTIDFKPFVITKISY